MTELEKPQDLVVPTSASSRTLLTGTTLSGKFPSQPWISGIT